MNAKRNALYEATHTPASGSVHRMQRPLADACAECQHQSAHHDQQRLYRWCVLLMTGPPADHFRATPCAV
eukprot:1999245-Pleurochrysis_carterae.AAC.1